MVSLKHISTLSTFNQTKFSADSTDSSYFLGSDQTQIFQGTPDVKYNDLCYIKCSNLQYTHGHLYGSTEVGEAHVSLTQEEYDALSEEEKNNGKIYLIKESTIPDLIDQLPVATTTTNGLMSAEDKDKLNYYIPVSGMSGYSTLEATLKAIVSKISSMGIQTYKIYFGFFTYSNLWRYEISFGSNSANHCYGIAHNNAACYSVIFGYSGGAWFLKTIYDHS